MAKDKGIDIMKLLFIQGGSRWKFDENGDVYTDANFTNSIWDRYLSLCDELTVILRKEAKTYSVSEATNKFNKFPQDRIKYLAVPDAYRPLKNIISISVQKEIKDVIKKAVKDADKVIIRSLGNIYTDTAMDCALRYNKPFLVEVTGFAFESLWFHSLHGKLVAFYKERTYIKRMKKVEWAVYVTEEALQKRYPAAGKMLGCSDVELEPVREDVLGKRIEKIRTPTPKIIIGTAAFLDVGWKGQKFVIKAISELSKQGIENIEYRLIGGGTGHKLLEYAKEQGVIDKVKLMGSLPHEEVASWLDDLDIYVQSSFMEGLCRSIVEAMSRGCPVICSDVGGNNELISNEFLFKKGDAHDAAEKIKKMLHIEVRLNAAKDNFNKAKNYSMEVLEDKRSSFYRAFIAE